MTKMDKKYRIRIEKCFSYQTVLLIALGIVINVIFPRLMIACSAPLYLDNIGSILVAALGGAVPGMLTAFISNYLGYFGEPSAMALWVITFITTIKGSPMFVMLVYCNACLKISSVAPNA